MATTLEPIIVKDTVEFIGRFKRNGVDWDLSGCTVTLLLTGPDGVTTLYDPTISSGQASYTTTTDDLVLHGDWKRAWRVTGSGVRLTSKGKPFYVAPALDE